MSNESEIQRLKERVRELRAILDNLDRSDPALAREAERVKNQISGIESEIRSLGG
jgi:FtsZ-binding cell division protein ZapB